MARRPRSELSFDEVLLSMVYQCPACGHRVEVPVMEYDIRSYSSPCDLCGDHGSVDIDARCECGHSVSIEVKEW